MMTRKRSAELALRQLKDDARNLRQPRLMRHHKKPRLAPPPDQLFNEDIWSHIVTFLNAVDLVRLALTSRFFLPIVMDDRVWKSLCLRHLRIREEVTISSDSTWKTLYLGVFAPVHSYSVHEAGKHIGWTRIGTFTMSSTRAVAVGRLWQPSGAAKLGRPSSIVHIANVKPGIWVADLHLLRCPLCSEPTCEGTLQVLQVRNWELFFYKEYQKGSWTYEEIASKKIPEKLAAAAGGVFDYEHLAARDKANAAMLNVSSWASSSSQAKCLVSPFAAAASTPLQENQGLLVRFYTMKAGKEGPVVGIRISHQLI